MRSSAARFGTGYCGNIDMTERKKLQSISSEAKAMTERAAREEAKLRKCLARQFADDIRRIDIEQLAADSKLKRIIERHLGHSGELVDTGVEPWTTAMEGLQVNEKAQNGTSCETTVTEPAVVTSLLPVSELADALLGLFRCGADADTSVVVEDQEFRVHKDILIVRSEYFSAMLCGGWQESDGGPLTIQGVSSTAFEHALHFMYGGLLTFNPSDVELRHLVVITDMFMLSGFHEMVVFMMRKHHCHFFHMPCTCAVKTVRLMPVVFSYPSFKGLYQTAVDWANKNFTRVWVTESFAKLPGEILQDCARNLINSLAISNVLSIATDANYMLEKLNPRHSYQPVNEVIVEVREACVLFVANHFVTTICHRSFLELNKGRSWNLITVETILTESLKRHPVDNLCSTYLKLCDLNNASVTELMVGMDFLSMVRSLAKTCKHVITTQINLIVDTHDWKLLPFQVQKDITEQAYFVKIGSSSVKKKPQLFSQTRKVAKPKSLRPPKPATPSSEPVPAPSKAPPKGKVSQLKQRNAEPKKPLDHRQHQRKALESSDNDTMSVDSLEEPDRMQDHGDRDAMFDSIEFDNEMCAENGVVLVELPEGQVFNVDMLQPVLNVNFYQPNV